MVIAHLPCKHTSVIDFKQKKKKSVWKQLFKQGFGLQRKLFGPGPNHSILMKPPVSLSPRLLTAHLGSGIGQSSPHLHPLRGHHLWHVKAEGSRGQMEPNPDDSGIANITLRHLWLSADCIICEFRATCTGTLAVSIADAEMALEPLKWAPWCHCVVGPEGFSPPKKPLVFWGRLNEYKTRAKSSQFTLSLCN